MTKVAPLILDLSYTGVSKKVIEASIAKYCNTHGWYATYIIMQTRII